MDQLNRIVLLVSALSFSSVYASEAQENSAYKDGLNLELAYGVGMRYSVYAFPFPLVNLNYRYGKSVFFVEATGSMVMVMGSLGFKYHFKPNLNITLANFEGALIGGSLWGSKVELVYTFGEKIKNKYSTRNRIRKSREFFDLSVGGYQLWAQTGYYSDSDGEKIYRETDYHLIPSVSLGYHWEFDMF